MHDRSTSAPLDPAQLDPGQLDPARSDPTRPDPATRPSAPRTDRPRLTLLLGGRSDAAAPFVVAPPALQRLDRVSTQAEIDLVRCRRVWRTVS